MTGESVKAFILKKGYNVAQVADMIGTSQQNLAANLKHSDVRSGLLEKIAAALGVPLLEIYGERVTDGPVMSASGSHYTQVAGNYSGTAPDSNILEILKMKDEQLLLTIRQVSKAQEQMDRILDRFGGATSSEDPEGI